MRTLIAIHKMFWFGILCLFTFPALAFWRLFFKNTRFFHTIAKTFHFLTCKIFGIQVVIKGDINKDKTIYVGNHLSYIDIPLLGSFLNATFISKQDVRKWPVLGPLAILADTVFISRQRDAVQKCIDDIYKRIAQDRSLILFPEGTSTDGTSVLPFKSSLFELFLNEKIKNNLTVQPFTITPLETNRVPVIDQNNLDEYAWYGDMDLEPHMWQLAKSKGIKVLVTFHQPHNAADYNDRKTFSLDCFNAVKKGQIDNSPR